jgi:hypothetical protein
MLAVALFIVTDYHYNLLHDGNCYQCYGQRRLDFNRCVWSIKMTAQSRWVLLGDFNLICHASDKNNPRVNHRLMNQFRSVLEDLELKELHLHGHRFTWSNGMANPTLTKIDHVFITKEWELAFPNCYLQALSTSVLDHCPLLITCTPFSRKYRGFRFEASWVNLQGFKEVVQQSCNQPVATNNKPRVLHIKLARLAKSLRR